MRWSGGKSSTRTSARSPPDPSRWSVHDYDAIIVGAGFAGAVLAEQLTNELDQRVLVIDENPYVGGTAHDHHDEHGVLVHTHGAHVFHTNAEHLIEYLSRFTAWT